MTLEELRTAARLVVTEGLKDMAEERVRMRVALAMDVLRLQYPPTVECSRTLGESR